MMLPFVLFADADGNFLDGYAGVSSAPKLLEKLNEHMPAEALNHASPDDFVHPPLGDRVTPQAQENSARPTVSRRKPRK